MCVFQICIIVELPFAILLSLVLTTSSGLPTCSKYKVSKDTIHPLYSTLYPRGSSASKGPVPTNPQTENFPLKRTERHVAHSLDAWTVRMRFLATYVPLEIAVRDLFDSTSTCNGQRSTFVTADGTPCATISPSLLGTSCCDFEPCNGQELDWEFVHTVMGRFFANVKRGQARSHDQLHRWLH